MIVKSIFYNNMIQRKQKINFIFWKKKKGISDDCKSLWNTKFRVLLCSTHLCVINFCSSINLITRNFLLFIFFSINFKLIDFQFRFRFYFLQNFYINRWLWILNLCNVPNKVNKSLVMCITCWRHLIPIQMYIYSYKYSLNAKLFVE